MIQIFKIKANRALPFLIFTFFFLIFITSNGGHNDVHDGVSYFLITENLVLNGSPSINYQTNISTAEDLGFDLDYYIFLWAYYNGAEKEWDTKSDEYKQNISFTQHARNFAERMKEGNFFGPGYLILPIIAASFYLMAPFLNISTVHFVPLMSNSIIIAVTCSIVFLFGRLLFKSDKVGFVLSIIFGVTSFMWPYITTMYARPLATLFLLLFIYLILNQRNKNKNYIPFFAGITLGLSFLSHPIFFLLLPGSIIFGLFEFRNKKKLLAIFLIGLSMILLLQLGLNYVRFDDAFNLGYGSIAANRSITEITFSGINGLFFSSGQSIFLYYPIAVLFPFSLFYLYKKEKRLTILFIYISTVTFLVALDPDWYKNPYWGPHRYLIPITPFVAISIGSLISEFKSRKWMASITLLASFGFIVNLFGNLVWVMYAFSYGWGVEGLWKLKDPALAFTWNPYHSPFIQTIKVLSSDWVANLPPVAEATTYFKIGLNGCSFDLYLFCEFGWIALVLLSIGISLNAWIIMKILMRKKVSKLNFNVKNYRKAEGLPEPTKIRNL